MKLHAIGPAPRSGRCICALASSALVALGLALPASGFALAGKPGASSQAAVLLAAHRVHRGPDARALQVGLLSPRAPITGEARTLPILARSIGRFGIPWLKVMLPGRPNGSSGWIAEQGTRRVRLHWRLVVDLDRRSVSAYRDGRLAKLFRAVVGKPSTPTPAGSFFVEESERMPAGHPGGPYALALSARSNVLREFEGGPGQIALHGRDNLGGVLGAAESHGCIRLATADLDWLVSRIVPGTPVTIQAS